MRKDRTNQRIALFVPMAVAATFLAAYAHGTVSAELSGQWMGNSQIEGDKLVAKTSLSLGSPEGENSTLRIDSRNTCTLKQGSYSAGADGAWNLSFKETTGGEACARLAKGTFVLHPGATPRQLDFEVSYPNSDGQQNLRRGALSRYP